MCICVVVIRPLSRLWSSSDCAGCSSRVWLWGMWSAVSIFLYVTPLCGPQTLLKIFLMLSSDGVRLYLIVDAQPDSRPIALQGQANRLALFSIGASGLSAAKHGWRWASRQHCWESVAVSRWAANRKRFLAGRAARWGLSDVLFLTSPELCMFA